LVGYLIIYKVSYIPGGCLKFLPSRVSSMRLPLCFFHLRIGDEDDLVPLRKRNGCGKGEKDETYFVPRDHPLKLVERGVKISLNLYAYI